MILQFSHKVMSDSLRPCGLRPPASSVYVFPRQEYWSGLPFPSPGDLPNPKTEPTSPALGGCCSVTKSYLTPCDPWIATHRLSYSPLSPRICSNSCPLSQRCHPTISSSVIPFSSCPQSFPALGASPMSWLFTSDGPSASATILPMNIQGWFSLGLTSLISFQS